MEKQDGDFIERKKLENEINEKLKTMKDKLQILDALIEMDSKKKKLGEADLKKRSHYVQKLKKIGKNMEDVFKEKDLSKDNKILLII